MKRFKKIISICFFTIVNIIFTIVNHHIFSGLSHFFGSCLCCVILIAIHKSFVNKRNTAVLFSNIAVWELHFCMVFLNIMAIGFNLVGAGIRFTSWQ